MALWRRNPRKFERAVGVCNGTWREIYVLIYRCDNYLFGFLKSIATPLIDGYKLIKKPVPRGFILIN